MVCYDRCWVRRDVGVGAMCSSSARVLSCLYGITNVMCGPCGVPCRVGRRCLDAVSTHTVLPLRWAWGVANGSLNPPTRGQELGCFSWPLAAHMHRLLGAGARTLGYDSHRIRPHLLQPAPCLMKASSPGITWQAYYVFFCSREI